MKEYRKALQSLTRVALLAALCIVLRQMFSYWGNVQPITAIFLAITVTFSLAEGLSVMVLTMFLTSFLLGFGIWVPFQLISFGLILILWRQFFRIVKKSLVMQTIIVGCLAFLYGVLIDSFLAMFYGTAWWSYVAAGAVFNINHAWSTSLFYPLTIKIFRRILHEKNL